MFRPMRRFKQELTREETVDIFNRNTCGVLSLLGDGGYPYGVPMSYVFTEGRLYFHSAKVGHKIDAVKGYNKASFCVIDEDDVRPEKYTTYFRSAIAFGRISVVENPNEVRTALEVLGNRYAPDNTKEMLEKEISSSLNALCMLRLDVEHISGKEAIELVKARG